MKDNILNTIQSIKNGDEQLFQELLNEYNNMIYKIINSFDLDRGDFKIDIDDLYQEASIALYKCVLDYDDSFEAQFSSYAYMCIKRDIIDSIRKKNIKYYRETYSLNAFKYNDHLQLLSVEDNPIEYHHKQELNRKMLDFIDLLSEQDRQILILKTRRVSYSEISDLLDIPNKKIDNRIQAIKRKYKEYDMDC